MLAALARRIYHHAPQQNAVPLGRRNDGVPTYKIPISMTGPYAGYESIEDAVAGLRRGRFRILQTFQLKTRDLFVVEGELLEGDVKSGMVLLPNTTRYSNILTPLPIESIEFVLHPGGVEHLGLVLGKSLRHEADLSVGTVVDVLERSPAP